MTVTQIVNDLLEHKMITTEAALVLLTAESKAQAFDNKNFNRNDIVYPVTSPLPDWTYDPHRPGQPYWTVNHTGGSISTDSDINKTEG